jgi:hypothetical protein
VPLETSAAGAYEHRRRDEEAVDLPVRRTDEDVRKPAFAPPDGPLCYLHHNDGSWSFVGNDGWPVSPEDYYAELDDAEVVIAALTCAPVDAELLTAVLRGLNTVDGAQPIPVRDVEV